MPPNAEKTVTSNAPYQPGTVGEAKFSALDSALTQLWMDDHETGGTTSYLNRGPPFVNYTQGPVSTTGHSSAGFDGASRAAIPLQLYDYPQQNVFDNPTTSSESSEHDSGFPPTSSLASPSTSTSNAPGEPDLEVGFFAKKCEVCGDDATGYAYNALGCLSCKTFVYRYSRRPRESLRCNEESNCSITVETRHHCRACRMKKCIAVGMIPIKRMTSPEKHRKRLRDSEDDQCPTGSTTTAYRDTRLDSAHNNAPPERHSLIQTRGFEFCGTSYPQREPPLRDPFGEQNLEHLRLVTRERVFPIQQSANLQFLIDMYGLWMKHLGRSSKTIPMHQDFNEADQLILLHETAKGRFVLSLLSRAQGKKDFEFHDDPQHTRLVGVPCADYGVCQFLEVLQSALVEVNSVQPTFEDYIMLDMMIYVNKKFLGLQDRRKLEYYIGYYVARLDAWMMNVEHLQRGRSAKLASILQLVLAASAKLSGILQMYRMNFRQ